MPGMRKFQMGTVSLSVVQVVKGFPGGSEGKASVCNAGDSGLIPELRRSAGEDIGYPPQ